MKQHPAWPYILKELESKRPILIPHDPDNDNTEVWKSLSAQQKGFDLCCSVLKITKE